MRRSFRILRTLGEGAFGAVHLVEIRDADDFVQTLAVKWLHQRWSQSPEYAMRLRDEARLLALLRHDSIVRVHGLTQIDGRLAILMEPVDGADLGRIRSMPPRAALQVCAAVADALDAAWSAIPAGSDAPLCVVHRDIKPSNVMVTGRGGVKVMDFGVARARFDTREAETRSQQFGTARYMAPERWLEGVSEAPSDVFSLGVTLLELISGAPMPQPRLSREGFDADIEQGLQYLDAQPAVAQLVRAMLAFTPEDRPSAEEVHQACVELARGAEGIELRAWARDVVPTLRNEGVENSLTGTVVREESDTGASTVDWDSLNTDAFVGATQAVEPELPEPRLERGERTRRTPMLAFGLIGLGLIAVGLAGWFTPERAPVTPSAEPVLVAPEPAPSAAAVPAPVVIPVPKTVAPTVREPSRPQQASPVATAAAPPPTPPPEEPQTAAVVFRFADDWSVITNDGPIQANRAQRLPLGTATVRLARGDTQKQCEIVVNPGVSTVEIDPEGRCRQ